MRRTFSKVVWLLTPAGRLNSCLWEVATPRRRHNVVHGVVHVVAHGVVHGVVHDVVHVVAHGVVHGVTSCTLGMHQERAPVDGCGTVVQMRRVLRWEE